MIKVITGIRRSGKTYLLFNLFYEHLVNSGTKNDHIIRIALDDWANRELRNPDNLYKYVKENIADEKMYYILLDEVQLVESFEEVLNGFLHIPNVDVYVTGSNQNFFQRTSSRNSVGVETRFTFIRFRSLNFCRATTKAKARLGVNIRFTEDFRSCATLRIVRTRQPTLSPFLQKHT